MIFKFFLVLFVFISFSNASEALLWNEVKNSNNIKLLELFKSKYPQSDLIVLANMKIAKLRKKSNLIKHNNIKLFQYGKYRCNRSVFIFNQNYSAYYSYGKKRYQGIWTTNGIEVKASFNMKNQYNIFTLKPYYNRYKVYKNSNLYCITQNRR